MSTCNKCNEHKNKCTCNDHGCPVQLDSKCVIYKGTNLTCLGKNKNSTAEQIFQAIDAIICDLDPETQITYIVDDVPGETVVTTTTVDDTVTYTVGIDPSILNDIITLQNDVNILQNNTSTLPVVLSTTSPEITLIENSPNNWSIDWTSPSSTNYDGIVYNDLTKSGTNGAGGTQTLKTFTKDYITDSLITTGDEIRFEVIGQIDPGANLLTDTVIVELYNVTTASVIATDQYSSFNTSPGKYSSFKFNGVISLASSTAGRYTLNLLVNNVANTTFSNCATFMKAYDVKTFDFSAFRINIKFVNDSLSISGNNYVHKLMVDVRKKI